MRGVYLLDFRECRLEIHVVDIVVGRTVDRSVEIHPEGRLDECRVLFFKTCSKKQCAVDSFSTS